MKTLQELYEEIKASEELSKEFSSLKTEEIEEFCEKHGCKTTLNEINRFIGIHLKNDYDPLSQVVGSKGDDGKGKNKGNSEGNSKGDGFTHKSFKDIDEDAIYHFGAIGDCFWECGVCKQRFPFINTVKDHLKDVHKIIYD